MTNSFQHNQTKTYAHVQIVFVEIKKTVSDPHANKVYQENIAGTDTVYKAISCDILKLAYGAVVDAARKVERAYPASAFFSDV